MTYIKELFNLPERVHQGDFVLRLTEGVSRAEETVRSYVVTQQLVGAFGEALGLIRSALAQRTSKAAYLHGSFGSGKSHFMAVLGLILQNNPQARALRPLADTIAKSNEWTDNRRFLIVPYHLIGAESLESAIFSGYVEHVRRLHPAAPLPGVYRTEQLFQDAQNLRATMGDTTFFAALKKSSFAQDDDGGWGDIDADSWNAESFEAAINARPLSEREKIESVAPTPLQLQREQLASDLIDAFFASFRGAGQYVTLDEGLARLSQHARQLGYDALILFLDELILWLATRAADFAFISREGQKLAKLVESQSAERPIPIVSFVARQRDLKELVGEHLPGAQQLGFSDVVKHWEGRFTTIKLEDRNLPAIAAERILKPKDETARQLLEQAFQEVARLRPEVLQTLLTSQAALPEFRQIYPFSPALMETLIAVSALLQRERTALRMMLQLLVSQRDTLRLGEIIPAGDLFDIISEGDEAFAGVMKKHFEDARKLYYHKLRPLLERDAGIRFDEAAAQPQTPHALRLRSDDRLVKTLLLAALAPNVESFRGLNASRLAALNHGTIRTPIAGQEAQEVLRRVRHWAAEVGEIKISHDPPHNPTVTVQLTGVDTRSILEQVASVDNYGNRVGKIKELLFQQFNTAAKDEFWQDYDFTWRATRRTCSLYFGNVYEMSATTLTNQSEGWLVVIDYPFDREGRGPRDDLAVLDEVKRQLSRPSRTLVWLPSFFSLAAQDDLGTLVRLDYLLTGERLENYVTHLPAVDRPAARSLLDSQRNQLRQRLIENLEEAYGLVTPKGRALDETHKLALAQQVQSLDPAFTPQPPLGANLEEAFLNLLDQALQQQYPAHPHFEAEAKLNLPTLRRIAEAIEKATQAQDGRLAVEQSARKDLRLVANPLKLGAMHETHFILSRHWEQHFTRQQAAHDGPLTVGQLRAWLEQPKPLGLPAEVQNLVLLAFALQTGNSFFRNGIPFTPALDNLPDNAELRLQELPAAAQWHNAVRLGETIFGISALPLLNAANVAKFAGEVKQRARAARDAGDHLLEGLTRLGNRFGLEAENVPRRRTALAVCHLLEQLDTAAPEQVISRLAGAQVATSEAAMKKSLAGAAALVEALRGVKWTLLETAFKLGPVGDGLRQNLVAAIRQDEYAARLAPALEEADQKATRLVTEAAERARPVTEARPAKSSGPGPAAPPGAATQEAASQRRVLASGTRDINGLADLADCWAGLQQEVTAHPQARLIIQWELYGD